MLAVAQHAQNYPHSGTYWLTLVLFLGGVLLIGNYMWREAREPSRTDVRGARGRPLTSVRDGSVNAIASARRSVPSVLSVRPPADLRLDGTSEPSPFDWSRDDA
jgi:hypothetical protein